MRAPTLMTTSCLLLVGCSDSNVQDETTGGGSGTTIVGVTVIDGTGAPAIATAFRIVGNRVMGEDFRRVATDEEVDAMKPLLERRASRSPPTSTPTPTGNPPWRCFSSSAISTTWRVPYLLSPRCRPRRKC